MGSGKLPTEPLPTESQRDNTWVLTDGSVGMENQGLAIAEAVGLPIIVKRVRRTGLMRHLPNRLQAVLPPARLLSAIDSAGDRLDPPWPRLLISIGRRSVALALAIRRTAGRATVALNIQDPKVPADRFDLVAAPAHDGLSGPNVVITLGSPHRVTPARLAAEGARFAPRLASLPAPRIAILIGGNSNAFRLTPDAARKLAADLRALALTTGATLLVTPSRRTSPEITAIIAQGLGDVPNFMWDGDGDNPYFGFLAHADAIIVTADSVNMITEAAGTGKPIYMYPLEGGSRRIARFHAAVIKAGAARWFDRTLASWSYTPINDTEKVAEAIRQRLRAECDR